ncbi:MAG: LacI family DNA-binding transcriptional regulator [Chloroflexota bacterium]|nr:MAG: LacI family DNA-binding transcriptional regulator [Chloroflexota bacterium]
MARKRATSQEVAREAGVSRTTVSLVLNDAPGSGIPESTRRRVLQAANRLNYYPNATGRRLVSGRTFTLAFVLHQNPERAAADLFLPEVLHGLGDSVRPANYHVLFHPVDPEDDEDGYAYLIHEGHVDGIILSGPQLEETEALELHRQRLPIVTNGRLPGHSIPFVDADNYLGAQMATNHLISLDHRRIGLITNAPLTYVSARERYRGYQDALLAADLIYDPELVELGFFTSESGYSAMNRLVDLADRPTAVFVASDVVAIGAMHAARARGLQIPQDMAIVGFDDVSIARFVEPQLSTVRLPAYELGWQVGQLALRLVNQDWPGERGHLMTPELVVRASCGADEKARQTTPSSSNNSSRR